MSTTAETPQATGNGAAPAGLLDDGRWKGRIYSGGWIDAPESLDTFEPATGELLASVGAADRAAVAAAAAAAAAAQPEWAQTPMIERTAIVRRAGELFERHRAELEHWLIRESGAIPPKAAVEITASIGQLEMAAALISHPLGQVLPSLTPGRTSLARRVPIGVVGVITPWNFPYVLAMRSVGPALALGNAVVLKSDPNTPVTGGVLLARLFEEAGLPAGLLHVLPGGTEVVRP
jgi:benzaldehyde dehydrogenase (NAD)